MNKPLALIVDDEPDICELLDLTLQRMGVATRIAMNLADAIDHAAREHFDLCLTDMKLPDGDGLSLVRHINSDGRETPVAVITAHGNMNSAVEALKAGAFDFVSKPVDLEVLRNLVTTALRLGQEYPERDRRTRDILIGDSPVMKELRGTIAKVCRSQAPVYISGESGTGKELVARMIHEKGPRSGQPFIAVNCGAIPAELMESEFFGHVKGSFTGAITDKKGLFQAAEGGTLFLDEVADLPLAMQVKLLRAIQERSVRPIGAAAEVPVNIRILSATHKDLQAMTTQGGFRQDLFYRLNVIEIKVPPLRGRAEDLVLLVPHILDKLGWREDQPAQLSKEALQRLQTYSFPGNIRELENILERALALSENNVISSKDLSLPAEGPATATGVRPPADEQPGLPPGQSLEQYLESVERRLLRQALEDSGHNKTAAARRLGISFRALRYRLKKLGLES